MKKELPFLGTATALITPFDGDNIDYHSLARLIDFQLCGGTDALVICGTTGEAPTLSETEKCELYEFCVKQVRKRVPVIAGVGSNSTQQAVRLTKAANKAGVDCLLAVTPYYNKCTQEGLQKYFSEIAKASDVPVMLYGVPARTGVTVEPQTCALLSRNKKIVAYKDAGDSITATARTIALCGDALPVYAGCDDRILPVLSLGGRGVVSVASNVIPSLMKKLCTLFFEGETEKAAKLFSKLMPLISMLFCEVNPIPVKALLAEMGYCQNILRPPLTKLSKGYIEKLKNELKKATE